MITRTEATAKAAAEEIALAISRAAASYVAEHQRVQHQEEIVDEQGVKTSADKSDGNTDAKDAKAPGKRTSKRVQAADKPRSPGGRAKKGSTKRSPEAGASSAPRDGDAVQAPVVEASADVAGASTSTQDVTPESKSTGKAPARKASARKASASKASASKASASKASVRKASARKVSARKASATVAPADEPPKNESKSRAPAVRTRRRASVALVTYPPPVQALVDRGRQVMGIENLRPGQPESLGHIAAGRDLLAVMPTGSGKSLLYQMPSLSLPGLTVVVSPLIALIKDQIDKMVEAGVPVCRFDSTLTVRQERAALALLAAPGGKLVLTTPERMVKPEFRELLRDGAGGVGVSLFVVDEAHCVSQWGHDFRPAYLSLRRALEDLGRPQVLATTATAPPHVRTDILFQLGIEDAAIVTTTFDRPNLYFEVIALPGDDEKFRTLVTLLKKLPKPGVVYCATVKKVDELYEKLARYKIPVSRYHGRMTKKERDTEQQRFMDSKDLIMIATNAFGLGVDKANIRYVLHYHVPGSLEAYAQEAGRGGRDKKPARCVLLFSPDDVAIQEYFLKGTYPTKRQVRAVYRSLQAWSEHEESPPTIANLAVGSHVGAQRTRTVLSLLKDEGFVVEHEDNTWALADPPPEESAVSEKARQYEARRIADRQRLDALLDYVQADGCRNQVILGYLGEDESPPCGRCDNCLRSRDAALAAADRARQLERSVTDALESDWDEDSLPKPKRIIRHRVIRIDEPAEESASADNDGQTGASAGKAAQTSKSSGASGAEPDGGGQRTKSRARKSKRTSGSAAQAASAADSRAVAEIVAERDDRPATDLTESASTSQSAVAQMSLPLAEDGESGSAAAPERRRSLDVAVQAGESVASVEDAATVPTDEERVAVGSAPVDSSSSSSARAAELGADELADVTADDGEYEYADDDEYEYADDDDEYEDADEDAEEDDDEYEYVDEYDDEYEYVDEDDDEYDDDDEYEYEIDKTAAALAEEGYEPTDTEITILARKRVPKPPRGKKPDAQASESSETGKRKRRRRRRRKKRSNLPPKSAFTSPVLAQPAPVKETTSYRGRRSHHGNSGPVIEYVRGPMRINMTPVASATPNDVAPSRKKKRRRRRGEEPVTQVDMTAIEESKPGRRRRRRRRRRQGRLSGAAEGPVTFFSVQGQSGAAPPPPTQPVPQASVAPAAGGESGGGHGADASGDGKSGKKRRRRRRRRGRGGRGNKKPQQTGQGGSENSSPPDDGSQGSPE